MFTIVGSGIKGILAAKKFSNKGNVNLIEQANRIGGILNGKKWKNYHLDFGCQLFDKILTENQRDFIELAQNNYITLKEKIGSLNNGHFSDGYSVLDVSHYIDTSEALSQLKHQANNTKIAHTLKEHYLNRFGNLVGQEVLKAKYQMIQAPLTEIDASANELISLNRIKIFDESTSKSLKHSSAFFDDRCALNNYASSRGDTLYLAKHSGLSDFTLQARNHLDKLGVNIKTGLSIDTLEKGQIKLANGEVVKHQKLVWCAGIDTLEKITRTTNILDSFIHKVPMVLIYFEVKSDDCADYDYVQNYNEADLISRASNMGRYSKQFDQGNTFICCEIPCQIDTPIWNDTNLFIDTIFKSLVSMKIIKDSTTHYLDHTILKAPATYKVPKVGFYNELNKFRAYLETNHNDLILPNPLLVGFGKCQQEIKEIERGLSL